MKKIIAGLLLILFLFAGYEALAAFPTFVASAVWSSNLKPDPDYIDEIDASFLAAPDSSSSDPIFTIGETQDEETVEGETPGQDLTNEEKPQEEITTPTDMDENEMEDPVIAIPDEAGIDTEKELEDEPIVKGEIDQ